MYAMLRSEKRKFFTFGWCVFGLMGAVTVPIISLFLSDSPMISGVEDILSQNLFALYLGQLGIIVASAAFWGQEYSHHTLRTTLLTQPARIKVLCTKLMTITIYTVITGIISSVLGFLVQILQHDIDWTGSILLQFLMNVILGILSWILLAWITSSLSIMTKSMIIPIAIILPLFAGLGQMLLEYFGWARFLPTLSTMNLFIRPTTSMYLSKWLGLVVQFSWGVVLVAISGWMFWLRDVR